MVTNCEICKGTFFVPLRMNFAKSLKSFVTLNGHNHEKNEGYKIFCDWTLLSPFSVKSFVTLNGHNHEKNEGYKIFCDDGLLGFFYINCFDTLNGHNRKKNEGYKIFKEKIVEKTRFKIYI
jgi:hypothetical protein